LIAEDDAAIAESVAYALGAEGFSVEMVGDGEAAANADVDGYDVLILDLMLPKLSGVEVCRRVRERSVIPIVMLTARTAEVDRVLGLEAGADDYVAKPFSMAELISRVRAILRRRSLDRQAAGLTRDVGGVRLDLAQQALVVDGRPVDVTSSEFRLLELLGRQPERAFTRKEIVEHLWRSSYVGGVRTCDVHVKNVRRKIERDPARPERLVTVRGVGYMLRAV
ncbi:MAG: response regulator, partial [Gaiellaceae bacterium]